MVKKSFEQYCAVAHALDEVGERWTLLIVRNLLISPMRFSDLLRSLVGISTNILTDRLKWLEHRQIVATRYLPPPAASTVYGLTERGYALAPSLSALAQWGAQTLGEPGAARRVTAESAAFMVLGVFWREAGLNVQLKCTVQVDDAHYSGTFGVHLSADGARLTETPDQPDVVLSLALAPLNLLSSRQVKLRKLITDHKATLEGDESAKEAVYAWVDA